MSVRKRPVITVVDARPMDEVGFRDARATSSASEVPQNFSPPPQKISPFSRPPPPANLNAAALDSNLVSPVPRKSVPSESKPSTDLTNALILDNQLSQSSAAPPPKPRRVPAPRPVTIHFDGQNNNVLPDHSMHPSAPKPLPCKRMSIRADKTTNEALIGNLPISTTTNDDTRNANDWSLDSSASSKVKPEVAPKKPTIIRVPTGEAKSESGVRPPPVATKSTAAKLQAAELLSTYDEGLSDSDGFTKPSTKPKPAARAKQGVGMDTDPIEDKPQPSADVRKRPTIIRPASVHAAFQLNNNPGSNPASGSNTGGPNGSNLASLNPSGPNPAVPTVAPRNLPPQETEQIPPQMRTAPTIIRPGSKARGVTNIQPEFSIKQPEIPTRQQPEIPDKHLEKPTPADGPVAPHPKKRPNIIRPNVDVGRKDVPESKVTISGGAVHFSAIGTSVSSEQQGTSTSQDVPPEKQNAENWKRIEMDDHRSVAPTRPTAPSCNSPPGQEGLPKKSIPPSKPPPPRLVVSPDDKKGNNSGESKSQSSDSVAPRRSGPPARPAAGPTMKPVRPTQPAKRISSIAEMAPSLPRRPTLGHPLFHYVVTGPHAIALFEYRPTHPDELQFNAGDVILLEKWMNSDWLQGRTAKASGMFPCSFVDVIEAPSAANTPSVAPVASSSVATPSSASWPGEGPRCSARFDYDGGDPADLAFAAGDVIRLVERVGNEWMRGELNGRLGMFPVGFVEIIEDLPPDVEPVNTSQSSSADVATVLFDFVGQPGELSLLSGTKVKILGVVNAEWLFGEFDGEKGRFPRAFVDHVPSGLPLFEDQQPQDAHDKVSDRPHCFALYDFVGQNPEDLSFSAGECISLVTRVGDDWLKGELNGLQGIFPAAFVRIGKDLDELPPRPKVTPGDVDATSGDTPHHLTTHDASNVSGGPDFKEKSTGDVMSSAEKTALAVAIYDFPGESKDDLAFHVGEVIEVTEVINSDWMSGKIGERFGIFPASFVKISS